MNISNQEKFNDQASRSRINSQAASNNYQLSSSRFNNQGTYFDHIDNEQDSLNNQSRGSGSN